MASDEDPYVLEVGLSTLPGVPFVSTTLATANPPVRGVPVRDSPYWPIQVSIEHENVTKPLARPGIIGIFCPCPTELLGLMPREKQVETDTDKFIERLEGISEFMQVRCMPYCLRGEAQIWFNNLSLEQQRWLCNAPLKSWISLLDRLWPSPETASRRLAKLSYSEEDWSKRMSLVQHANEVLHLVNRLAPERRSRRPTEFIWKSIQKRLHNKLYKRGVKYHLSMDDYMSILKKIDQGRRDGRVSKALEEDGLKYYRN
ncbi:hypothetical protein BDY21DRAFT_360775 [Lineolata rhizophorae]|uniref:Retrotransposon gag domain-containing protein n=1 Tax=Lineolata rhizophorae TaxID=578093 RepID=A0A6A6PCW2_9PEZI|nr:hypothetical protein BDY21DRAFT_360775 [Lineolata rhizophorae]